MPLIQSMVLLEREISSPAPQKRGCFYMAHGAFSRHCALQAGPDPVCAELSFPWKPVRSGNQPADIAEWCCTAASSFPLKPGAKPGCHFRKSRTRMESTGTGAPQHERRNALFNPPRNKSGRPLQWPPCPVLSCRAGLICGRIMDEPASDLIPHEQEYQFDAGRPCKKK